MPVVAGAAAVYQFIAKPAILAVVTQAFERAANFFSLLKELFDVAVNVEKATQEKNAQQLTALTPKMRQLEAQARADAAVIERWATSMGHSLTAFAEEIDIVRHASELRTEQREAVKSVLRLLTDMSKWMAQSAPNLMGSATQYVDETLMKAKKLSA